MAGAIDQQSIIQPNAVSFHPSMIPTTPSNPSLSHLFLTSISVDQRVQTNMGRTSTKGMFLCCVSLFLRRLRLCHSSLLQLLCAAACGCTPFLRQPAKRTVEHMQKLLDAVHIALVLVFVPSSLSCLHHSPSCCTPGRSNRSACRPLHNPFLVPLFSFFSLSACSCGKARRPIRSNLSSHSFSTDCKFRPDPSQGTVSHSSSSLGDSATLPEQRCSLHSPPIALTARGAATEKSKQA